MISLVAITVFPSSLLPHPPSSTTRPGHPYGIHGSGIRTRGSSSRIRECRTDDQVVLLLMVDPDGVSWIRYEGFTDLASGSHGSGIGNSRFRFGGIMDPNRRSMDPGCGVLDPGGFMDTGSLPPSLPPMNPPDGRFTNLERGFVYLRIS